MKRIIYALAGVCVVALTATTSTSFAVNLHLTSPPVGYQSHSVELGVPFSGALVQDPTNDSLVYVSSGSFVSQRVLRVNVDTGTTEAVTAFLGGIGGLAVLSNGDLAISENITSDTVLRARDLNSDGDFLEEGEITELISPILVDFSFSGTQMAVAPSGNASGIPAGSLLLQTADGETSSELLVIEDPTGTPAFRPLGGAYYSGYQYNGGFAFDPIGNIVFGISQFSFETFMSSGRIVALVNSNADTDIDAGESNTLLDESILFAGLTDLAVSKERQLFYGENSGSVQMSLLPDNLLTEEASEPTVFAGTDGAYISTIRLSHPERPFAPGSVGARSRMYVGGLDNFFGNTTNLIVLTPVAPSAVSDWELYN